MRPITKMYVESKMDDILNGSDILIASTRSNSPRPVTYGAIGKKDFSSFYVMADVMAPIMIMLAPQHELLNPSVPAHIPLSPVAFPACPPMIWSRRKGDIT
jgi:hypothetical protein